MACEVVEVMGRARRRHVLGGADRQPLEAVVGVARGDGRADGELVETVAVVVAVIVGGAVVPPRASAVMLPAPSWALCETTIPFTPIVDRGS
jgi:hypothetical protein